LPFATINDLKVYYEVHGEGEPILLLHHGFGSAKIFEAIYPQFVAHGFKVVLYDRRGFGRSDAGDDFQNFYETDRYRPESLQELQALKELLDIRKSHIVGQCEGGVIGVDYAVKYPDEVITLTAASTQCYSDVPMAELNTAKLVNNFMSLEPQLQAKVVNWHGKDAESRYNQFTKYGGAYGSGFFDLRPLLPLVPCPTLVLYPDRSSIFDVEQSVAFYRHLKQGELAVFPRCGHNTYEQRPEDYARTILDFIRRSGGREVSKTQPAMTCLA
jgi:pimeloyl-ACP methyl ester carboxylesterase